MRRKDREITDENLVREIISRADVCRLALIDGDLPYIVALNFGEKYGDPIKLYFHSAPEGRKIELLKKNPVVCFQMDIDHELRPSEIACDCSMNYKSIVGYGKIRFLEESEERKVALDAIMNHYSSEKKTSYDYSGKYLKTTAIMELVVESLSCKMRQM